MSNGVDDTEEDVAEDEDDEDAISLRKQKGFSLIFDVVRRFAQPLGIHLDRWEGRIIETRKGVVRLLSVTERAQQLFGKEGAQAIADHLERSPAGCCATQALLRRDRGNRAHYERRSGTSERTEWPSYLMRHSPLSTRPRRWTASTWLCCSRRVDARTLCVPFSCRARSRPRFSKIGQCPLALYPKTSEEKRLLDAMLLAMPK